MRPGIFVAVMSAAISAWSAQAATVTGTTTGWVDIYDRGSWCGSSNCGEIATVGFTFNLPVQATSYTLTVQSTGYGLAFFDGNKADLFYSNPRMVYSYDPRLCGNFIEYSCRQTGAVLDDLQYEYEIFTVSGKITYVMSADTDFPDWLFDPDLGFDYWLVSTGPVSLDVFNAFATEWLTSMTANVSYSYEVADDIPAVPLPATAPLMAGALLLASGAAARRGFGLRRSKSKRAI